MVFTKKLGNITSEALDSWGFHESIGIASTTRSLTSILLTGRLDQTKFVAGELIARSVVFAILPDGTAGGSYIAMSHDLGRSLTKVRLSSRNTGKT